MKNTTKSFTAVAIVLLLLLTLAACGSKTRKEAANQPYVSGVKISLKIYS